MKPWPRYKPNSNPYQRTFKNSSQVCLLVRNQAGLPPETDVAAELQTIIASRQKLEAQKQENLGVKKEFDKLKDEETIYKLIGPVLLKQDKVEADGTVNGRLEFIGKEM